MVVDNDEAVVGVGARDSPLGAPSIDRSFPVPTFDRVLNGPTA
jgi:hypothetical protein